MKSIHIIITIPNDFPQEWLILSSFDKRFSPTDKDDNRYCTVCGKLYAPEECVVIHTDKWVYYYCPKHLQRIGVYCTVPLKKLPLDKRLE